MLTLVCYFICLCCSLNHHSESIFNLINTTNLERSVFCRSPPRHSLRRHQVLRGKETSFKQTNKQTTQLPAMSVQDPQDSSLFFQNLPTEIRLEIYSYLFYSTRLSFGKRSTYVPDRLSAIRLRPAPNGLSLLRVCRRVSNEIGDSWLGQVLFSFEDPVTMLDKLADLDLQTRGKLRHIRYSNRNSLVMESVLSQVHRTYGGHIGCQNGSRCCVACALIGLLFSANPWHSADTLSWML